MRIMAATIISKLMNRARRSPPFLDSASRNLAHRPHHLCTPCYRVSVYSPGFLSSFILPLFLIWFHCRATVRTQASSPNAFKNAFQVLIWAAVLVFFFISGRFVGRRVRNWIVRNVLCRCLRGLCFTYSFLFILLTSSCFWFRDILSTVSRIEVWLCSCCCVFLQDGPKPLAASDSLPSFGGTESLVNQERQRIEELLRTRGVPRGSYPPFSVAAKGQKVDTNTVLWSLLWWSMMPLFGFTATEAG